MSRGITPHLRDIGKRIGHRVRNEPGNARPPRRSQYALDWLSFFVADIQTGFGPFVAVYLASGGWRPGEIGLVLTFGAIAAVISQTPSGALLDAMTAKRSLMAVALAMIAAGALLFALWPRFLPVTVAELLDGSAAGFLRIALAAVGLGLVGHGALGRRLGRNQSFSSLGNAATVGLMGLLGHFTSGNAPFLFAGALCLPAGIALAMIRSRDIDYAAARSAADRENPRKGHRLRDQARNYRLHVFVFSLVLFQFANASLMPLAGGRLGYDHKQSSELVGSILILSPQLIAAVFAMAVAKLADDWGRKPILILGLGFVGLRALLFAVISNPWTLLPVQLLDGFSAAVVGVMMPLVIADLTRGTGRYNLAQGFAGTATGISAAISTACSGYAVQLLGYTTGFLGLAVIGFAGAAVLYWFFPETKARDKAKAGGDRRDRSR
ncbi:MAG TPA: MFS transporter [Dongiaceae bacterium]|nr:MFS transporter [Dongiaceae bacterium]